MDIQKLSNPFRTAATNMGRNNSILATAPITSDISLFMLAKTGEWLRKPKNAELEQWEKVVPAYAETVIQVISLQLTMLMKLHDKIFDQQ